MPITRTGAHPDKIVRWWQFDGAQTDQVLVAGVAGKILELTSLDVAYHDSAAAAMSITIGFGTTATPVLVTDQSVDGVVWSHPGCPAGGGVSKSDGEAHHGAGAKGESLLLTCSAPGGQTVRIGVGFHFVHAP